MNASWTRKGPLHATIECGVALCLEDQQGVLEGREALIGVARYVRTDARDVAEFAIVVADAWQGRGIGTLLLGRLIECARGAGVARLVGDVLSTKNVMLRLARRLGFTLERAIGAQGVRLAVLRLSDRVTMPEATQRGTAAAL